MPKQDIKRKMLAGLGNMTIPQATSNAPMNDVDLGVEEELQLLQEMEPEDQSDLRDIIRNAIKEWVRAKTQTAKAPTPPAGVKEIPKVGT